MVVSLGVTNGSHLTKCKHCFLFHGIAQNLRQPKTEPTVVVLVRVYQNLSEDRSINKTSSYFFLVIILIRIRLDHTEVTVYEKL